MKYATAFKFNTPYQRSTINNIPIITKQNKFLNKTYSCHISYGKMGLQLIIRLKDYLVED